MTKELRLKRVPEEAYMAIINARNNESIRLKRECNLTDGLRRLAADYKAAQNEIKDLKAKLGNIVGESA